MKKRNIFLTVAGLAGMMLLGQGATAQQSADRQSNSDSSINKNDRSADSSANRGDASSAKSRDQSDSAGTAGDRAGQNQGRIGDRGQGLASRGQSSKENDQKFVECVAGMDQFEIQAAQLAEQQAQDDQIKEFAKQLLQDHEQTGKQLQQIAQQAGIPVSEQLKPPQQAMLQELKQMQGEEFDKAYVYGNVAGHTIAVLKFRDASRQSQNPQLKQFARQTLPKLQQHLRQAQELANWDEAAQAQTAGARERASSPADRSGHDSTFDRSSTDTGTRRGTGTGAGTTDSKTPGSSSNQQGGQQ